MTVIAHNRQLDSDVRDVVALLRRNTPPRYLATEFLISSSLRNEIRPGGKLHRILRRVEQEMARKGFEGWAAPSELENAVAAVSAAVRQLPDAAAHAVVLSLLRDTEPPVLQHVDVE